MIISHLQIYFPHMKDLCNGYIWDNHYGQKSCDLFMEYIISTQVSSIKNILETVTTAQDRDIIVITNFSQWVESFVNFVKQYANYLHIS